MGKEIKLNTLSDWELLCIVEELQGEYFDENSVIRRLAIQFFGDDSLTNMLFVGLKVLPVVAERMKIYSPHVD